MTTSDHVISMILWGPPGCGKTSLSRLISAVFERFYVYFDWILLFLKDLTKFLDIFAVSRANLMDFRTSLPL